MKIEKESKPKVSIVVPVYNVENYLDRCLESLVNQTLKNIEIILVDDKSPDNSPQLCDRWANKDDRIKVVHKQKNEGLGFARNSGLDVATGEYVAFVDSDDYVEVDMYDTLYHKLKEKNVELVVCGIKYIYKNGVVRDLTDVSSTLELKDFQIQSYIYDMIACAPYVKADRLYGVSSCRNLYNLNIINNNSLRFKSEREVLSEDLVFNIEYLQKISTLISLPIAFYYYCQNESSTSSSFKSDKFVRSKSLYSAVLNLLGNEQESKQRAERMFIGYFRGYVLALVESKTKKKIESIREILRDPIFNDIKSDYKPEFLPFYHRAFYWLQIHHHSILVYLLALLIIGVKSLKQKIRSSFIH